MHDLRHFHKFEAIECLLLLSEALAFSRSDGAARVIHTHGINALACMHYANELMVVESSSPNPTLHK